MSVSLEDLVRLEVRRLKSLIEKHSFSTDIRNAKVISEYLEELLVLYEKIK